MSRSRSDSSTAVPTTGTHSSGAIRRPSNLRAWLLAARPKTLTAAWAPVIVGTACAAAAGRARLDVALAALLGASLIQIGTNFANDVFDFEKGADDEARVGPMRAVQAGLITPGQMRVAMALTFVAAAVVGLYLVSVGGWPIVVIGLASIAAGIAYTGGPFPLGYNGLGDVFVMLFFGYVAVCTTAWLQVGRVVPASFVCATGVGAMATAILVVNNLRDADTDVSAGKRTLVVRFGRTFGRGEFATLVIIAFLVPLVLSLGMDFRPAVLIALLAAPLGSRLSTEVINATRGEEYNVLLGRTAGLLLLYSVLLSAGLVIGAP